MTPGLLLWTLGWLVVTVLCAVFWDKYPLLRFLPPIYGFFAGLIYSGLNYSFNDQFLQILQFILVSIFCGWGFWFAVWAERHNR